MADYLKIYRLCDHCQGKGTIRQTITAPDPDNESTTEDVTCPTCKGYLLEGWDKSSYEWGRMIEVEPPGG